MIPASLVRKQASFAKLPKAQQRVRIAKDVLEQLRLKRLIATHGTYVRTTGKVVSLDTEVCSLTAGKDCYVCGLGALFVAGVERADAFKVGDSTRAQQFIPVESLRFEGASGRDCYAYLKRFFSESQLQAIENWFEGFGNGDKAPRELYPAAWLDFTSEQRMRRIMQNIVDNGGTFKPRKLAGRA